MSEQVDLQQLFRKWRSGDERSGHEMAQRFSDWYYAVTASRLGDRDGRPPLERSCRRFQEGITELSDPNALMTWAHGILVEELQTSGMRLHGGDQPNGLTGARSPTELIKQASAHMEAQDIRLLVHTYDADYPIDDLSREADEAGGYPMAVLNARYALKRALREQLDIELGVVPTKPKLDLAPLPLYEAGRMTEPEEEKAFELWMLNDIELCRDLAEFAAFALALRGGALTVPKPVPADGPAPINPIKPTGEEVVPQELAPPPTSASPTPSGGGSVIPKVIGGVVVLAVLVAALGFIAMKFL